MFIRFHMKDVECIAMLYWKCTYRHIAKPLTMGTVYTILPALLINKLNLVSSRYSCHNTDYGNKLLYMYILIVFFLTKK